MNQEKKKSRKELREIKQAAPSLKTLIYGTQSALNS